MQPTLTTFEVGKTETVVVAYLHFYCCAMMDGSFINTVLGKLMDKILCCDFYTQPLGRQGYLYYLLWK